VLAQRYGWRLSFIVFGALGVLLGLVLSRHLRDPDGAATAAARQGAPTQPAAAAGDAPARTPRAALACLLGAFMCANFVAVVLLSWMPKYLFDRFHMSLGMAGLTATAFVQLASMAGAPIGGWLADAWRQRSAGGRIGVQAVGMLAGAPFVAICGLTTSMTTLVVALTCWGFFKGLYDANIFASAFDLVAPEARGRTAGWMNMIGWLAGGGSAPLVIGLVAERSSLGTALALASVVYVAAAALLCAAIVFARRGAAADGSVNLRARET